jgi:environmental stress-induced protein Ves
MRNLTFLKTDEIAPVPWKNGGGVTREIAQISGPAGFAWRLSMADVATEGGFSNFQGMSRILTVIEGDGLELHSLDHAYDVAFCQPFSFSGEASIRSVLRDGPIRDFNVIFDPTVIDAEVSVVCGAKHIELVPSVDVTLAVFGVVGEFTCDGVKGQSGSFALIDSDAISMNVPEGSVVLLVRLLDRNTDEQPML